MTEDAVIETLERTEAPARPDLAPVAQAFADLDEKVAESALKSLSRVFDLGASSALDVVRELQGLPVGAEIKTVLAHALRSIANEYERARNTKELEKTLIPDLETEWKRALAQAAEEISAQNAHREKQVRDVLTILINAKEGRTEQQNALQLEVYNMNAKSLVEDDQAWSTFETLLETRQLNSLQPDVGYNICVLPYELGDPDNATTAAVENAANFVKRLANLGERLNIVFFLDVHTAGKEALMANPVEATRGSAQHEALTDTLKFLSWDPKDKGRLGLKLASLFGGNDVSRYIVLNGGVGLLAQRKMDEDLLESDVRHGVLVSPSSVSAGLTAWSVAGEGVPLIPSGSSPGTGGIAGVSAVACVALREHQELARRAAVNSVFIPELTTGGAVDTSVTLARADPKFNENVGQCSVEAILLSQYINRVAAQFVRKLSKNDHNTRKDEIIYPLRDELEQLKRKDILREYSVEDHDMMDKLAAEKNQINIEITFIEVGKLDRAKITVTRASGGAQEGKD